MRSSPLKPGIDASALLLLDFLERNRAEEHFEFPFSFSFPRNACESVSLILTYLIEEKYGLDTVEIIKGTKPKKHEHHFWVKVGDWQYDLTAHQFGQRKPIIGVFAHQLFLSYPEWGIERGRDFVERDAVLELYRAGVIPF
ncbi:hypothetical protein CA223_04395 [Sphingomonas koreensis]|jgi:hypothetical protein|uniref:Microcin J25-processing protein McjB C-terminal domain-containing protein n=2 Tax=Sphingomonas koreensis TaxID=93064 RepID=A0A1L6JB72_9SPHN|nr:hypothetical protein [Sphingomonas koreensis]APR53174.1 hypothetical protein BRX40_12740 [Sphingomonas koreensis]RSU24699.1 hypothetical protein CA224_03085 [Sphingomonas koreensis]RSU24995.1 hypothetical protein CA225_16945 [Sphingomonas koreensis]RSU27031.1 hypothetical protein CA222_08365 [Sphingomonas koreensis]RSU32866.1 hypothetical protein BRX39_14195 [Sphingomonas koreensis]